MSVITVTNTGNFEKTKKFLETAKNIKTKVRIKTIAAEGVKSLEEHTPIDTGKTASSWSYEITEEKGKTIVSWNNDNVVKGVNIAIILQYGHGTRNGGYVVGRDYINPSMKPIFDKMTDDMWKAVVSS